MKKSGKEEKKKLMINSFCVVREREILVIFRLRYRISIDRELNRSI